VAPRRPTNNFSPPNDHNQLYLPRTTNTYSRQSVDFNEQFYDDEQQMEKRPTVYKRRVAPPTPPPMSPVKVPGTPNWRKKSIAPPPPSSASPRMNPIRELEQRGRQAMEEAESENAPFNFQGMLRKTTYNRSSMKRSASENAYVSNNFANNLKSRDDQQSNMVYSSNNQGGQV
jgi:myosin III